MSAEKQQDLIVQLVKEFCDLLRKCTPWVAVGWLGWCVVHIARAFAGQMTTAQINVFVDFLADIGSPVYPWTLTVIAVSYAWFQRRERMRKTQSLQSRIIQLELKIEPNRTSSMLETDGSTRREDRL